MMKKVNVIWIWNQVFGAYSSLSGKSRNWYPLNWEKCSNSPIKTSGDTNLLYFFIILLMVLSFGCDASIAKYEPKNKDEREIISVLIQYQDAKNNFDIQRLQAVLHDKGQFSFECGLMVSKAKLKEALPVLWAELQAGNTAVIPLVHECINGDYYKSGRLNNPHIELNNNTAEATVLYTKGVCRILKYFSMIRENDRWLITRTEWGHH